MTTFPKSVPLSLGPNSPADPGADLALRRLVKGLRPLAAQDGFSLGGFRGAASWLHLEIGGNTNEAFVLPVGLEPTSPLQRALVDLSRSRGATLAPDLAHAAMRAVSSAAGPCLVELPPQLEETPVESLRAGLYGSILELPGILARRPRPIGRWSEVVVAAAFAVTYLERGPPPPLDLATLRAITGELARSDALTAAGRLAAESALLSGRAMERHSLEAPPDDPDAASTWGDPICVRRTRSTRWLVSASPLVAPFARAFARGSLPA